MVPHQKTLPEHGTPGQGEGRENTPCRLPALLDAMPIPSCQTPGLLPITRLTGHYVVPSGIQEANDCIFEVEQVGTHLAKKATIEFPLFCLYVRFGMQESPDGFTFQDFRRPKNLRDCTSHDHVLRKFRPG